MAIKSNVLAQNIRTELLAIKILLSGLFLLLIPLSLSYNEIINVVGIYPIFTVMSFCFSSIHTLMYINKFIQKSLLVKAITSFMKVITDQYC